MEVKLVVEKGSKRPQTLTLRGREALVGRHPDCTLRIPSSEVSRRHCVLSLHNGALVVEDLDSANGTYVNARRIKGKQVLRSGDRLEVGPVRFILRFDDPAAVVEPVEDVAEVEAVEDSDLDLAPVAEESGLVEAKLVGDDEETADDEAAEALEVLDEMDKAEGWHLPEAEDFRDLLTRMEEPDPPKKPRKK